MAMFNCPFQFPFGTNRTDPKMAHLSMPFRRHLPLDPVIKQLIVVPRPIRHHRFGQLIPILHTPALFNPSESCCASVPTGLQFFFTATVRKEMEN
ncbi:chromosomal replication initiator protein DnaA [Anopheles sinensis]|uniref:Chromosomal replication initiator protein DnaA n=1 Tax=Anopheles sinensis TaxID=74873 RepID=A0A084W151_ANOSI|nr:chromosomal replication initiator protein DnaA [Anopheles sinensis]